MMKRQRTIDLSEEEIAATLDRYDAAVKDGFPWSRSKSKICAVCRHPECRSINKLLLVGQVHYETLRQMYDIDIAQFFRHWGTHLAQYIDPDFSRKTLLNQVSHIAAHRSYPKSRTPETQYRWVIEQLVVTRDLLLDEVEAGMPLRMPNSEALQDYIEVLMKIKQIIPLTHTPSKRQPVKKEPESTEMDDEITPEQEKEMLRAAENKKRNVTEEQNGKLQNGKLGRNDPTDSRPATDGQAGDRAEDVGGRAAPSTTPSGS